MKRLIPLFSIFTGLTIVAILLGSYSLMPAEAYCRSKTLKEMATAEFEAANYPLAIEYLQQALSQSPEDAEIYYLLGYYKHYLCYDSVPLMGFSRDDSDEVLHYLRKAVELDPDNGNAFYFIGAEYGARARDEMQKGNARGVVEQFELGRQAGGYPDWMIEYGRNSLRSCEKDAVLFVGGDAETNPIQYLQSVHRYRTDVTVIPLALLDRPWFVRLLKEGLEDIVRPAPISWSARQIEKMRPYKWKSNVIKIPIPETMSPESDLERSYTEWELKPDLGRGEELSLLSASRAVFADLLLSNSWKRPIYFSLGCGTGILEGLDKNILLSGFVRQLSPVEPSITIDADKTKTFLLDDDNFKDLSTARDHDMPRVSSLLQNYGVQYFYLIYHCVQINDIETGRALYSAMRRNLPEDIVPMNEAVKKTFEALESKLNELDNK
jgi:tetratricopeptide (TPR) repeat protein